MLLKLYKCTKRYNSTMVVEDTETNHINVWVEVRGGVTITSPTFILQTDKGSPNYFEYNYAYCEYWGRYYFINNMYFDGNRTFIECHEDTLASWHQRVVNNTYFCVRSASDYNASYTDMLFPAVAYQSVFSSKMENPWSDVTEGNYVVAIASGDNSQSHIGSNVYYILDTDEMTDFMDCLMSKADLSIASLASELIKTMVNPISYIRSIYWFPFTLKCNTVSVSKIHFGWWSADVSCKAINLKDNADSYTTFDFTIESREAMFKTDDDVMRYQRYPPYSKYTFTAYPFGVLELSTAAITHLETGNNIEASIYVDHITGMGEMVLHNEDKTIPYMVTTAQVGVEIPVGEILQDYAGGLLNSIGVVGSAVSGNVVGAANGVYNAIESVVPTPTVQGIAGGFAQLMLDEYWSLSRYWSKNYPALELKGGICCANKKPVDMEGYAQFSDVEIIGPMFLEEKLEIKSLLEEGIFIE